jgi:polyhydroxyalkanoate synthesis regulator protein
MPGFDAMRAEQEAFLKAMTGGMGGMGNWKAPDKGEAPGGDDLDEIKSQLAQLQAKLDRMEK